MICSAPGFELMCRRMISAAVGIGSRVMNQNIMPLIAVVIRRTKDRTATGQSGRAQAQAKIVTPRCSTGAKGDMIGRR
jgi:hypothetical protein